MHLWLNSPSRVGMDNTILGFYPKWPLLSKHIGLYPSTCNHPLLNTGLFRSVVRKNWREYAHAPVFELKIPTKSCACANSSSFFVTTDLKSPVLKKTLQLWEEFKLLLKSLWLRHIQCFCDALPTINSFNKAMQKNSPTIHYLHDEVLSAIKASPKKSAQHRPVILWI